MLIPQYDSIAFSKDAIARWGHLSEDLLDDENLIHTQMGHLGRLCISVPSEAESILQFLEETMARPDAISEIENAVAISFLDWAELSALGPGVVLATHLAQVIHKYSQAL
jgi:hypothetical protein